MKRLIDWFLVISLSSALFGCSAQYHLKKAIKKDSSLFDTTYIHSQLSIDIIDQYKVDTLFENTVSDVKDIIWDKVTKEEMDSVSTVIRKHINKDNISGTTKDIKKDTLLENGSKVNVSLNKGKLEINNSTPIIHHEKPLSFKDRINIFFGVLKWILLISMIIFLASKILKLYNINIVSIVVKFVKNLF